jgi:hypothetical protein
MPTPVKYKLKDCDMMKNFMTLGSLTWGREFEEDSGESGATPLLWDDAVMTVYNCHTPVLKSTEPKPPYVHEEGGGSDRWGPLGSDMREETLFTDCANSKKRRLLANTPRLLTPSWPSGPSARTAAYGAKWAGIARGWEGWARIGGKIISE